MNDDANDDLEEPPHKVGDVLEEDGVPMMVTSISRTKGGAWMIGKSAEPLAQEKGYITQEQSLGFRIEHFPPPFVACGVRRDPAKMGDADWNFVELMKRPEQERKLALFHELARESARLREACRLYYQLPESVQEINTAEAQGKEDYALHKKWSPKQMRERQAHDDAVRFLDRLERRLPFEAGELLVDLVAKDLAWNEMNDEMQKKVLGRQAEILKKKAGEARHKSLEISDVPGAVPDWPFDHPIQFSYDAQERGQWGQPSYAFNDGIPRRLVLASKGNGSDAQRILSESLELCVCLNFRDEEILDSFKAWLEWRRKGLHDDLADFRVSAKRPYTKLKANNVDAALKGLAALRLRAAKPPLEAASEFDRIYFPNATHRKVDIGNVEKQARIAVEWQTMFLRYCPLDSAGPVNPDLGIWDRECSLCFHVTRLDEEPNSIRTHHTPCRCGVCDHRESMGWDGQRWVPYED